MQYRTLGKTGYQVSTVSFGAWAIGGSWGTVDDNESLDAMRASLDAGVNFIDTADVYGDGRSERLIAQLAKERPGTFKVATKAGRRLDPHTAEGYTPANIEAFVERSMTNLQMDCLDLVQLHCPPSDVYYNPVLFEGIEKISKKGKVRFWGVSVSSPEEAIKAIDYDIVCSVQIIFNCFRLRPAELFFEQAKKRNVGILARVPLSSGLLTGQLDPTKKFPADDHRHFNLHGARFDAGETFSGMGHDMPTAFKAVDELKKLLLPGQTLTQFSLRWIQMFDAVTCSIPGGKRRSQIIENCSAADAPALTNTQMLGVEKVYNDLLKKHVHYRW